MLNKIKELRKETSCSVMECKKALEESRGNLEKARQKLIESGAKLLSEKDEKQTQHGLIVSYIHRDRIGVLIEVLCQTDFAANSDELKKLARELSMQVAATDPKDAKELLKQPYIRDESQAVNDLVSAAVSKIREKIEISRFIRFELGEKNNVAKRN